MLQKNKSASKDPSPYSYVLESISLSERLDLHPSRSRQARLRPDPHRSLEEVDTAAVTVAGNDTPGLPGRSSLVVGVVAVVADTSQNPPVPGIPFGDVQVC